MERQGYSVTLTSLTAAQVRACIEDFCNAHKGHPNLDMWYRVEGISGQLGLVHYCASMRLSYDIIRWAKEKLVMMDPVQWCLIYDYEASDNNLGIKAYVTTIKVLTIHGTYGDNGCMIEWSYVADPFEGCGLEDLVSHIDNFLQFMAKKVELEHSFLQNG